MAEIATGNIESTVSDWAAPIVGGMVSAAVDTAGQDYQTYSGDQVAGTSDLQNKAFTGIDSLTTPSSISNATTALTNVYNKAATQPAYTGTTFNNTFQAPQAYTPSTFTSGFTAPQAYQGAEYQNVQSYMNPYLQNVVDVQAREARRQADIQAAQDARKFQGAFGGGRQALFQSEANRNLNQQIGDIQAKGLSSAYDTALKQRQAEFDAREAQKQFGAKQGLAAAELAAKYGLDAQRLGEESRQFGAKQGLTSAELAAKYGLDAAKESEASKQFGANLGLKYLTEAENAATNMGNIGVNEANYGLNKLKTMKDFGDTQRTITQQGLTADYADWLAQRDWDKTQQKYLKDILSGLPMTTQNQYTQAPTTSSSILGGAVTASEIYNKLYNKKP